MFSFYTGHPYRIFTKDTDFSTRLTFDLFIETYSSMLSFQWCLAWCSPGGNIDWFYRILWCCHSFFLFVLFGFFFSVRACSKCIWSNSAKEFHTNVNYYLSYCYFYYFCLLVYLDFQRVFYMCARVCVHIYKTINTQLKMVYKWAGIFLSQNDTTDWLYIA